MEDDDFELCENDETRYMDRALESWIWWQNGVGPQQPVSFGDLFNISSEDIGSRMLALSEDQFLLIDQTIARLSEHDRELIDIEYRWSATQERKAEFFCVSRKTYVKKVLELKANLYADLMPDIEVWRESVL
jgi:hypothetical protein